MTDTSRQDKGPDHRCSAPARHQDAGTNEATSRALGQAWPRSSPEERVRALADRAITRYGPLLDRLAQ